MANIIPEQLINFKVYNGFSDMIGVADVTLPSLEAMTNEVKGAGIAGTYNSSVTGHYSPMSMTLNWRVITGDALKLAAPGAHQLDIRGVIDTYDAGDGKKKPTAVVVTVKAMPKKVDLGKLDPGQKMDTQSEFEITYLKVKYAGVKKVEIDKLNYICFIGDKDYLADVRAGLGMLS